MMMKPTIADVVVVERKVMGNKDDFTMPSGDQYDEFKEGMEKLVNRAQELGLEDFTHKLALSSMKVQGIGMFYPGLVDENDNTEPSPKNGKYHLPANDVVKAMQWVEEHLWQNRMKDFATGVIMFAANLLMEMSSGEHTSLKADAISAYKEEHPNEKPDDFAIASYTIVTCLELIMTNQSAFRKMYEQVVEHEEPELITIGDPRTVSSIIQGGYTSDTISKEEVLEGMKQKVTDKDIEKFLNEVMKDEEE